MYPLTLTTAQQCDLELLLNGGFAPLTSYLREKEYLSVLNTLHLPSPTSTKKEEGEGAANGDLWPIPICLRVDRKVKEQLSSGDEVQLKDEQGFLLATLSLEEIYPVNGELEAKSIYGCLDQTHEQIKELLTQERYCLAGSLKREQLPIHYDFLQLRKTPSQMKQLFVERGWNTVIGFQTRNPMHRSHYELTKLCQKMVGEECKLLLHPVVGPTQSGDIDYRVRVRCYQQILNHYDQDSVELSLLPLAMRMAGPREAMLHALIRKNYGCTHFIVGRDHAGPSVKREDGTSFFGPYDAQQLLEEHKEELGIQIVTSEFVVYEPTTEKYYQLSKVPEGLKPVNISGTRLREMLATGEEIPEWYSYPDVVAELKRSVVPVSERGYCVYFTGLSGSGKSSLANALKVRLEELESKRKVSILDGDQVRLHLSKGLGFSKEDRSTNVKRIGYVASEIVKHGGVCLAANIAPYKEDREWNRKIISQYGKYIEVFVNTSLGVCEERDVKGLYKLAREGKIKQFTGISDPYEKPTDAELVINSIDNINQLVDQVVEHLNEYKLL